MGLSLAKTVRFWLYATAILGASLGAAPDSSDREGKNLLVKKR